MEYIHYGSDTFDIKKFEKVTNWEMMSKPKGGFWASRVDTNYGWLQWCMGNEFCVEKLNTHFTFMLSENAKILTIDNYEQLKNLPLNSNLPIDVPISWIMLDFEELAKEYDAIEVLISNDYNKLYFGLYGWDCDSILIMNPNIIIEEK